MLLFLDFQVCSSCLVENTDSFRSRDSSFDYECFPEPVQQIKDKANPVDHQFLEPVTFLNGRISKLQRL